MERFASSVKLASRNFDGHIMDPVPYSFEYLDKQGRSFLNSIDPELCRGRPAGGAKGGGG